MSPKKRQEKIKKHRAETDLRKFNNKRIKLNDINKVRLYKIYSKEIDSVRSAINSHVIKVIKGKELKLDAYKSLIYDFIEGLFVKAKIEHFGELRAGGVANVEHDKKFDDLFVSLTSVQAVDNKKNVDNLLNLSINDNVNKITTVSSAYFDNIKDLTLNAYKKGIDNETLVKQVKAYVDKGALNTKANAKLIATDQIQKLNASLDMIRAKSNGIDAGIWRTSRNARVRDDHKILEGALINMDGPYPITVSKGKRAGERNPPGHDINCKCYFELVLDYILGEQSDKLKKAKEKTKELKQQGII
jgi:hypothetical protein